MTTGKHLRRLTVAAIAGSALLVAPAGAHAALVVTAKDFATQEAAPLSRTTLATFSDDAAGSPGSFSCSASTYTGTIDWGDGTAPSPAKILERFGGDFAMCAYTVTGDHNYAHFGVFTTTVSVGGGPLGHTGADNGEITVADVNIKGEAETINATAGQVFNNEVARFKDANEFSSAGDFVASIDWGDGTPITTGQITGDKGDFRVIGQHTYASGGSFAVRVTFAHPTAAPAVALGSATVAGPAAGPGPGPAPQFSFNMRLLSSAISRTSLRSRGLSVRVTLQGSSARNLTVQILRNNRRVASSSLRLSRTDGRAQTVKWRPSASVLRKLRNNVQYGFRIRVNGQTLTRAFRIRAARR